jgi:hypothetical protein
MPAEPLALSTRPPPEPSAETDYDAICAAVTATARGRWFLDEYARRNRNSDTAEVLAAIARMETAVLADRAQQASRTVEQEVRIELLEMARTIAQARAEVADSRPQPAQDLAASSTEASPAPDVATAAERLRQIAWTMRACGIDLPVSDQIGQVAEAILSTDAQRSLGDQRARRLSEALQYLEQRIDRMLESHRAEATAPQANSHDRSTAGEARAPRLAIVASAVTAEAASRAPSPVVVEDAASSDTAAAGASELAIDDDVVLTVADSATEAETVQAEAVQAETLQVETVQAEPAALELEPLPSPSESKAADVADETNSKSPELELDPLVAEPAEAQAALHPAVADETCDERTLVIDTVDDPNEAFAEAPLVEEASPEPADKAPVAAKADTIAMQVDQDLDDLTQITPANDTGNAAESRVEIPSVDVRPVHTTDVADEDPADFLLEAPNDNVPPPAAAASTRAERATVSHALAAIESELLADPTLLQAATTASAPPPPPVATSAAKQAPENSGPLAALMAMSDEERIALFS